MNRFEQSFDRSINQSTVSRILQKFNEDPDLLLAAESTGKTTKQKREVQWSELESALLDWFLQYEKDSLISGEILWEKARVLYGLMYPMDEEPLLKFSNGWLSGSLI